LLPATPTAFGVTCSELESSNRSTIFAPAIRRPNPQLLNYLTKRFVEGKFNTREVIKEICNSRTYQLSIATNKWNEKDETNFSHAKARRLPAETLYDAVHFVTGVTPNIPGAGAGTRASQLPDAKLDLKSGFLANLGRPARESACECERSDDLQMSAVMAFLSGPGHRRCDWFRYQRIA
jgi:hypothetical protein